MTKTYHPSRGPILGHPTEAAQEPEAETSPCLAVAQGLGKDAGPTTPDFFLLLYIAHASNFFFLILSHNTYLLRASLSKIQIIAYDAFFQCRKT